MTLSRTAILAAAFVSSHTAFAQARARIITLDLGTPTLTQNIEPGSYTFRIINRLPNQAYTLDVSEERIAVDPFDKIPHTGQSPLFDISTVPDCSAAIGSLKKALDATTLENRLGRTLSDWL